VTKFEEPLDFRDGYLPAARGLPIVPTIETTALLAVLLAYAVGFAILYPIAQTSGVKERVDRRRPGADGSRRPLIRRGRAPMHAAEDRWLTG